MGCLRWRAAVRLREMERRLVRLFGGLSNRDLEYDFARRQIVGRGSTVLDVGGCDSLLPLELAKRGFDITVYDFRGYPERHPNLESRQGDFLDNDLPESTFDFVVMVSTIEHIGFGSYGAPVCDDGDFRAMAEVKRLLKPSGRLVITFPFASKAHKVSGFERWYDLDRVRRLFEGLYVLTEEYWVPHRKLLGRWVKWLPASLDELTSVDDVVQAFGYQCNACYLLCRTPRPNFA